MKVLICQNHAAAIERTAGLIVDHVARRPDAVLGLATGGTMLPLYERLATLYSEGEVSFANVTSFNLDEYVGIAPAHPASYHSYMKEVLFSHVDIGESRTHLPLGNSPDVQAEAERYEAAIAAAGGLSLQLLGIGQNGHIGFNEPTSSLGSRTRIKTLTESTRTANRQYFGPDETPPAYAITMGVGTILAARECLLLATGRAKAQAVAAMIEGPVSAVCPASALQLHPHATIVLDREASGDLRLTDYYQHVHPDGEATRFD
ncbi:glucosamine-6-phosphate deaminase [Tropicimonas isoalkanivorans]|uniref:Glucosamine-6-phosphate deaminase n=1 Tax=Tropicimonas isoalkanivorans TaxID=441112 RepID=A0A1I1RYE2_9RHOB|nr:glucosamine-6-phosphate deaminase [Tropicimonas isoalkanivorans]SFD35670.1 glucosamine-6-phosphate deaminase [Tropicimonas isoalkanivorans]